MTKIEFSKEEKESIVGRIQHYFNEEHEQEIGQFDAEFLLGFFAQEIGPYFYNRGVLDARAVLESRIESISEAMDLLEKPVESR